MNLTNYSRIAFAYLKKNQQYTLLNVFGLSVGLSCFIIIGLWVRSELSFDRMHSKANRIYRIGMTLQDETSSTQQAVTGPALAPAMLKDFPEVEDVVRIDPTDATIRIGAETFVEDNVLMTEPGFFRMFDFRFLSGDRNTALSEPYSIVLSETMAKKHFPDGDPVGKSLRIFRYDADGEGLEFKITGVIEDAPHNSHFNYTALISFKTWEVARPEASIGWYNYVVHSYVLLNDNASVSALESKLPTLVSNYLTSDPNEKSGLSFFVQKLTDIHLHSKLMFDFVGQNGSMTFVIIFGSVGIVILLLAGINYVNLATAYSTTRFKEVGIQKVMGASKRQLITQYITEAWILCAVSLVFAVGWVELARPLFEAMTGARLYGMYDWNNIITLIAITIFVGIAAGFYPSLILSNYSALNAMKGKVGKLSGGLLRKFLLTTQYAITAVLVIGIVVIQMQMKFIRDHDLGFDENKMVVFGVHGSEEIRKGYDVFANELKTSNAIAGITRANTTMGGGVGNSFAYIQDAEGKRISTTVYRLRADHDYLKTYNIKLLAGHDFIEGNAADSTGAFIVNEAMVARMGFQNPADAIDRQVELDNIKGRVIGVVKDFNYDGLHQRVDPMCIWLLKGGFSRISIRLKGDVKENFNTVTAAWKKHFPASPMQYRFLEDTLSSEYESDNRFSNVFLVFSGISLAIACLGLFSLVSYNVQRRAKEIGIRKVLGASVTNILAMVSREFLTVISIGLIIAIPIGYYFMDQWLTSFAYHISLELWMFMVAVSAVLIVAWITISYRSIQAASANPTESLRRE
jgi:putative ABC transport system permease protein